MSLTGTTSKANELAALRTIPRAANWVALPEALSSQGVFGAYPPGSENYSFGAPYMRITPCALFPLVGGMCASDAAFFFGEAGYGYSAPRAIVGLSEFDLRVKGTYPAISAPVYPAVRDMLASADGKVYAACAGYEDVGPGSVYASSDGATWTSDHEPATTSEVQKIVDFKGKPFAFALQSSGNTFYVWKKSGGVWSNDGTISSASIIYSVATSASLIYVFPSGGKMWIGNGAGDWIDTWWYTVGTRTVTRGAILGAYLYTICKSSTISAIVRMRLIDGAVDTIYEFPVNPTVCAMTASDTYLYCSVSISGVSQVLRSLDGVAWEVVLSSSVYTVRDMKWLRGRVVMLADSMLYFGQEL